MNNHFNLCYHDTMVVSLKRIGSTFFFVVIFLQSYSYSDSTRIELHTSVDTLASTYVQPAVKGKPDSGYRGLPVGFDQYAIYYFDLQPKQSIYQQYLHGTISRNEFLELAKRLRIDTCLLSKEFINQRLSIFVGLRNGVKTIIADSDKDYDFANNQSVDYNVAELPSITRDSIKSIAVKYEYFYGSVKHQREMLFKILPFSKSYKNSDSLQVYISQAQHQLGQFYIDNEKYQVSLSQPTAPGGNYSRSFIDIKRYGERWIHFNPFIQESDTFQLEGKFYIMKNVSEFGEYIDLIEVKSAKPKIGYRVGEIFPFDSIYDINEKAIKLQSLIRDNRNRFVLFDFWGTWCQPCIKEIPSLIQLTKDYPHEISVISVAYDRDKEKVKECVLKNGMNWDHTFVNLKSTGHSIITDLRVDCFPTYLVVDENLKIVYRSCGLGLNDLKDFLQLRLKEN